jgi:hypothetical protein
MFGHTSLADLRSRTEYEAWLLEAVYDIANQRIAVENVDQIIFPASGARPTVTAYGAASVRMGDWRPGFLRAGAPLVFVTVFKLLDMLVEWVLAENDHKATHRFEQKVGLLGGRIEFPALIDDRPWLKERLKALYEKLEPLRGTIIHARHFKSTDGGIEVQSSKSGSLGPLIAITANDLRTLALLLVSLLRYLEGAWAMDAFHEKRIRRSLDELAHLHSLELLGQLIPTFYCVRVYVPEGESISCDLDKIRREIAALRPNEDVVFDLQIVTITSDGSRATAYLIPWEQLRASGALLERPTQELAPFKTDVPTQLDLASLARDLATRGAPAP